MYFPTRDPEKVYRGLDSHRRPVMRSMKKAMGNFRRKHFIGDECVLEVGSGNGFLRSIMEHKGEWVQLDYSERGLKSYHGLSVQASAWTAPLLVLNEISF